MLLVEKEVHIPMWKGNVSLLEYFKETIKDKLSPGEIPVRFVVTQSSSDTIFCELGILIGTNNTPALSPIPLFEFVPRKIENTNEFNAVLLVPTGIGAEIGGHAGDACSAARLLASVCDTLITHPNVVNASDINELPENGLYVEGSIISRLLMGTVGLQKVRSNRVLLLIDKHKDRRIYENTINAVSAARVTLGLNCLLVIEIETPIKMHAEYSTSGRAVGKIDGLERLCRVLSRHRSEFDAVAIASMINIPNKADENYFQSQGDMVNPWGGVEALLTHAVSLLFGIPSAHSPMARNLEEANKHFGIVDPRMSAETLSVCSLHSVLKGLHRSPRIVVDSTIFGYPGVLSAADISCLVIPYGCVGLPTLAALEQGIPVIAVHENGNRMKNKLETLPFPPGKLFIVDNYLEAVGIMAAFKAGVAPSSIHRPLGYTSVLVEGDDDE